jgi:hypothetical protein
MLACHTYLFMPGTWTQKGVYRYRGAALTVEGFRRVIQQPDGWVIDDELSDATAHDPMFSCRALTAPLTAETRFAQLDVRHNSFGSMRGKLIVVENTIMISFASLVGRRLVNEYIVKVSDTMYTSDAFIFAGEEETGSWSLRLEKKE